MSNIFIYKFFDEVSFKTDLYNFMLRSLEIIKTNDYVNESWSLWKDPCTTNMGFKSLQKKSKKSGIDFLIFINILLIFINILY